MHISIVTLFPQLFDVLFAQSIIGRAQKAKKIKIETIDLRNFGIGKHKLVDDRPYGGGAGMVLRVDVMDEAIRATRKKDMREAVILLDPKGKVFKQEIAEDLSKYEHLILICGHYEGFDERIRDLVDFEVSIGDYVLSGGELAAAVVAEAVARLVPGVLKKEDAPKNESFSIVEGKRLLEHAQYTRPPKYKEEQVPAVLLSGNFQKIDQHRTEEAKKLTKKRRPDLS